MDQLERRIDQLAGDVEALAVGHDEFARSAQTHLAALQTEIDGLAAVQQALDRLHRLAQATADAVADLERAHTLLAAELARRDVDDLPP